MVSTLDHGVVILKSGGVIDGLQRIERAVFQNVFNQLPMGVSME